MSTQARVSLDAAAKAASSDGCEVLVCTPTVDDSIVPSSTTIAQAPFVLLGPVIFMIFFSDFFLQIFVSLVSGVSFLQI